VLLVVFVSCGRNVAACDIQIQLTAPRKESLSRMSDMLLAQKSCDL
jgi:hypothetical protein